jgi:alkylation response protein AidB-like acyl-CoA dehydrogenase
MPDTAEAWLERAREVARTLRSSAVERDQPDREPHAEADLLRRSGLPALLAPRQHGGGGEDFATALAVVREVARADASIGQLIGYSYANQAKLWFNGTPEQQDRLLGATAQHRWLWGGAVNPLDTAVEFEPTEDGYRMRGRRTFTTGFSVADANVVSGVRSDSGDAVQAILVGKPDDVGLGGDWDNLGMRLSASGSVTFSGTHVAARDILSATDGADPVPRQTLLTPAIQCMFCHLYLGTTEGALDTAAEYTRTHGRPWFLSGEESAARDPYVLQTYGQLVAQTQAVAALAETTATEVAAAIAAGDRLTWQHRGEVAARVAALKVVSTRLANDATSRIFEVTGARATANRHGLDRFWRNVRTHTLHDPVSWKENEVGAFFLAGRLAEPTLYT